MTMTTIRSVRAVMTAPEGIDLVIVVVETSEPGLTGYGCATFTQRASAVHDVVERYLSPLLAGRDVSRIEDLWRLMMANSYWRSGPVLNNAIGGVDMALWDIKGKQAGMPLYQLLGGACRDRVDVYRHADGSSLAEVVASAKRLVASGHRYVRCQIGGYGAAGAMTKSANAESSTDGRAVDPVDDRVPIDPRRYMALATEMLHHVRGELGPDVELLHDIHERVPVGELPRFAKGLDDVGLFFLEDPVPPDQSAWLRNIRDASVTPIALGELFTSPEQWLQIIQDRLIDFIRVHISHIGGITPARRLAALCDAYGVRTAWHGPGDCSPFGHAANVHLDFAVPNFGIQEMYQPAPVMDRVFPGVLTVTDGAVYPPERPGLGIDFDEAAAAEFPPALVPPKWTRTRSPDGTLIWP
ncbi:MAG: starvation-sensing protein RspA [Spirochaetaceae bacterium]|nr:MAG: starvation-sensing protein RspA [Spirochaetaceae bacterium]